MTEDIRGGLMYSVPLNELPGMLSLVHRGTAWASTNGVTLPSELLKRIADLEATVAMLRPVDRTAEVAPPPVAPSATPLHLPKMDDVKGLVVVSPAAACRLLGVSRQWVNHRLLAGSLAGWKDDRGHWRIPVSVLEGAREKGA
jgi:hypothetical protein